jgi:hypothetical protein
MPQGNCRIQEKRVERWGSKYYREIFTDSLLKRWNLSRAQYKAKEWVSRKSYNNKKGKILYRYKSFNHTINNFELTDE